MQIPYIEDVGTNHAAIKKCGKVEIEGDDIPVFEGFAADYIGRHGKEKEPAERSGSGNKNAHPIGSDNLLRILEDNLVGFKRKITGKYAVAVKAYRLV
jgi:hypothetical protein